MAKPQAFSLRESEQFVEHVWDALGDFKRWDEVSEALTFLMARNPYAVPVIEGTHLRAIPIAQIGKAVYFTIEEEEGMVTLRALF